MKLEEFHELQYSLMKEFCSCCERHNITCYMVGGTLLGAVKYKGFIPWDDDVDFAIPRSQYELLCANSQKWLSDCFLLETYNTSKAFIWPYAKLIYTPEPIISVSYDSWNKEHEVFNKFDIYPIDGLGSNIKKARKHIKSTLFLRRLLAVNTDYDYGSKNIVKRIIKKLFHIVPTRLLLRFLENKMKKYSIEDSAYITRWRGPDYFKNIILKEVFEPSIKLKFCDEYFLAPNKYDAYLRSVYGDYTMPAKTNETQIARHSLDENCQAKNYKNHICEIKKK